jgi:hypothetical protein
VKKLLALCLLVAGMAAQAQNYPANVAQLLKGPTTLTNASTDSTRVAISGLKKAITFKYDIAKTSGTVAGTIVLKGRVVKSALGTSTEQWAVINTYTLTDATATNSVLLTGNNYTDYLIVTTTTGTQVSVHRKYLQYN